MNTSIYTKFDIQLYPLVEVIDLSNDLQEIVLNPLDDFEEDYEYIPQPDDNEEEF